MKKILSVVLAFFMIASVFATITVSADEAGTGTEGNWEVHLDAFEESKIENGEESFQPRPGYEYTDDGFEIIPPEYKNVEAKYTVISKTKYSTKNFKIQIRLDDYPTEGDNWVSFSFWSEKHGLAQGSSNSDGSFGYGWYSLLRDQVDTYSEYDGKLSHMQTYSCGSSKNPGGNVPTETIEFQPVIGDDGLQYITFEVRNYIIYINGVEIGSNTTACKALRGSFKDDAFLAYFGISVKGGLKDTPVKFTITEVDGVKPAGTDSAAPDIKNREYGPMIDASTIPAGTPGVLFDASFEKQNVKMPSITGATVDATEANSFKFTTLNGAGCYAGFSVKDSYSVDIKDFPYILVVLKNFCTCEPEEGVPMAENCYFDEQGGIYYCAGDVITYRDDYKCYFTGDDMVDVTPEGSEDYYTIIWKKIDTDVFEADEDGNRIHSLRVDFAYTIPGQEFEILSAGYFANADDIVSFVSGQGYNLTIDDLGIEEDDDDVTSGDPDEENTTEENYDDTPLDDETEETTTKKKKENKTTEASEEDVKKGGCGSVVNMGAVAIIATAFAAGVVTFKKKKEN